MIGETYTCDRCNESVSCHTHEAFYKLDGVDLVVNTEPAWCHTCGTLRRIERLSDPDFYVQRLASLESDGLSDDDREFVAMFNRDEHAHLARLKTEVRVALGWRINRQSPPRCMQCGSTDAEPLPPDDDGELLPFSHPQCGGTFHFVGGSIGSSVAFFLDSEGQRLTDESTVT